MKKIFLLLFCSVLALGQNLALKNYREIYFNLLTMTNIQPDEKLEAQYKGLREMLPKFGNIDEFNGAMQLALLQITSEFCERRVNLDSQVEPSKRWLHTEVNFSKNAKDFTEKEKEFLVQEYAQIFWQRAATESEARLATSAFDGFAAQGFSTVQALVFYCTLLATSIPAVTI